MASQKSDVENTGPQGSVYLITSDGRTLSLPIPSQSPCDPLNWSLWRKCLALGAMSFFTIVGLILAQGTSMFLSDLAVEYATELVSSSRALLMNAS